MMTTIKSFFADESGATAIEYGLIAALIAVACIVAMGTLGSNLNTMFSSVASQVASTSTGTP